MNTDILAPKQIWQSEEGIEARVLRVFSDLGRAGSFTSMVPCLQVRYYNLRTKRQTTARAETFLDNFPIGPLTRMSE